LNRDNKKKKNMLRPESTAAFCRQQQQFPNPAIHTHKRTQNALNVTAVAGRRKHKLTYLTDVEKSASRRQCLAWHGSRPDDQPETGKDRSDPYEQHEIKPRLMLLRSSSLQAAQLPGPEAWGSRRQ
jgi:hypothetical protein